MIICRDSIFNQLLWDAGDEQSVRQARESLAKAAQNDEFNGSSTTTNVSLCDAQAHLSSHAHAVCTAYEWVALVTYAYLSTLR